MKDKFVLDFIGIGAEKAGTTWLAEMLNSHPNVCMSEPKEIHYFNEKDSYIRGGVNKKREETWDWYKKHFNHCQKKCKKGEFSTFYLFDESAPRNIRSKLPDVPIFVCLRDPIERAVSQYKMYKNKLKVEGRPFEEVIKEEKEYLDKGLYYKQLQNYLKYFPKEQIHIFFFDEIKNNPEAVVKRAYNILGVDDSYLPKGIREMHNVAQVTRSKVIFNLMSLYTKMSVRFGLTKLTVLLKNLGIKKLFMSLNTRDVQDPVEYNRDELLEYFEKDIQKLEEFTKKDLSKWLR